MNALRWALGVVTAVCLSGLTARAEDKPDYAKLIVGKWEATKAAPDTVPQGAVIEFTKDGKLKATFKRSDGTDSVEGTYKLDGDKIQTKIGDQEPLTITIVKISETEMSTKDKDGNEVLLKRKK